MKTFSIISFIELLLYVSIPLSGFTQTQDLKFEHLSVRDGLSNNSVLSVIQDREGFMWFGTGAGLNKYDGYTFTAFNPDPKYPDSTLRDNYIMDLHEDGKGRLWVGGYGLHQFDKRTGNVTAYLADTSRFTYLNVNCTVYEDKEGILWTSSGGGLNRFDPATKQFISYTSPKLVPNYGVVEDGTGKIWMGSDVGLYQFDRKTATFKSFPLASNSNPYLPIMALLLDKEKVLWIGTSQEGLFRVDTKRKQAHAEHYNPEGQINKIVNRNGIFEDRSGYIWTATTEGLQQIDKKANKVTTFRANPAIPGSLNSNNVLSVYQDRTGTLWVGTDNGINKTPAYINPFSGLQIKNSAQLVRHSENIIKTLLEDKTGMVWLGTVMGLYKFNSRNKLLNYVPLPSNHYDDNRFDAVNKSLSNEIWVIHEDYKGRLWVGTATGLYLLNRTTGKFRHFPCKIPVHFMDEDSFGKFWIPGGFQQSGNAVMAVFDLRTLAYSYTEYALNDSTGMKDMYLNGIMASRKGDIWIATKAWGISRMNRETGKFAYYFPDTKLSDSTLNDWNVWCLHEDKKGIIWAGTKKGGLNRLDPTTGKFSHFTTHEGLPSNFILSIAEDDAGNLWLATGKGLSRFNLKTKTFRNFDISDGLPDDGFMPGAVYRGQEKLLFGTSNGLILFDPDSIKENTVVPPVYLTNLKVLEKSRIIPDSLLELPYNENFLAFEFVALNYHSPEKNQYAYQLMGLDKDWIYSGSRRYASYPDLAPGKYTFRVKAANNDGTWNEKGTSVTIVIHPPWWKTWWAYCLYSITVLGIFYSIYYIRVSRLKELLKMRNKIASDLHDDIGSTLSSINIMSEVAKQKTPGSSILLEKIGSDAQLMQENMSDIVWAINPKNDRFENVIQRMKIFASEMLEAKNITLRFSADETLNNLKLTMNQRKDLYFIFKEAVTNIAKYSECKNAVVTTSLHDKVLDLMIKDDGKGFNIAHQTMGGNGLYNIEKRAKDLNGTLKIDSTKGRGTIVHLQFKII